MPKHGPRKSQEDIRKYKKALKSVPKREDTLSGEESESFESTSDNINQDWSLKESEKREKTRKLSLPMKLRLFFKEKPLGIFIFTIVAFIVGNFLWHFFTTVYDNNIQLNLISKNLNNISSQITIVEDKYKQLFQDNNKQDKELIAIKSELVDKDVITEIIINLNSIQKDIDILRERFEEIK